MNRFFVSGMFRSGTTAVARALNSHPKIACASDPMAEFFKAFRSDVAERMGLSVPVMAPLQDYYFDPKGQALFENIMKVSGLDMIFKAWTHSQLIAKLSAKSETYSAALRPYLQNIGGQSYKEVLESLFTSIKNAYGDDGTEAVGFKEVWTNEFVPVLGREYPEMKFVLIVRDPRAVCASKKMQEEQYPWPFLARQWRKLASIQWLLQTDPELQGRVFSLKYEDFVSNPVVTLQRLTEFIGVDEHPDVADPSKYKDGAGEPWIQNTSYGIGGQSMDMQAIQRWRQVLTGPEVALIEHFCAPEMALFGYKAEARREASKNPELICNPPKVTDKSVAGWMKGAVSNDSDVLAAQMGVESVRESILRLPAEKRAGVPEQVVKSSFLSRKLLDAL